MAVRFTDRMRAGLAELRAQARLRLWTLGYELEMRRETASHEQRNLASAGYSLLLAVCGMLGRL